MTDLRASKDRIAELWPCRHYMHERESIRSLLRLAKKIRNSRKGGTSSG